VSAGFIAALDGQQVEFACVKVPYVGVWTARVVTVEPWAPSSTTATLTLGARALSGLVERFETFAGRSTVELVGGVFGWGRTVPGQHHHGAVSLASVLQALATAAGERLTLQIPDRDLGGDFVRPSGPAAGVLTAVLGSTPWWVDLDGSTRVGPRPAVDISGRVQVLELDGDDAALGFVGDQLDDVADVLPGVTITDATRLGSVALVVQESTITTSKNGLRAGCRVARVDAAEPPQGSRVAALVAGLAERADPYRVHARGPFRYRVYGQAGDRVELQKVRPDLRIPDVLPARMAGGVPGFKWELQPGAIVLVDFVEGDPALPFVVGYATDEPGAAPELLTGEATTSVELGLLGATGWALRDGDLVNVPGLGVVTLTLAPAIVAPGVPGTGRSKVKL